MPTFKIIQQWDGDFRYTHPRAPFAVGVFPKTRIVDVQIAPPSLIDRGKNIKKLPDVWKLIRAGDFKVLLEEPGDFIWARISILKDDELTWERKRELLAILDKWRPGDIVDDDIVKGGKALLLTISADDSTPDKPLIIRFIDP